MSAKWCGKSRISIWCRCSDGNTWHGNSISVSIENNILIDCFNSLIRDIVDKGFANELTNRNVADDSCNTKKQNTLFLLPQSWQFESIRMATKYGIKEPTRKIKIKNECPSNVCVDCPECGCYPCFFLQFLFVLPAQKWITIIYT